MNTSAPFMTDMQQHDIVKKQQAELYMQIYQYASRDFITTADFTTYSRNMEIYLVTLEAQLQALTSLLSSHTHMIPPHSDKSMSMTLAPVTGSAMAWKDVPNPIYVNTTLTPPNLTGNFIQISPGSEGFITPTVRRADPLPITLKPTIPPVLAFKGF